MGTDGAGVVLVELLEKGLNRVVAGFRCRKPPAGYGACRAPCSPPLASGHLRHPGTRSLPPAERCVISLARSQPAALRTQKAVPPSVPGAGGGGRASLCCPPCVGVSALCLCTRTLRAEKEHPYCSRVSSEGSLKIQARSSPCTPVSEERQGTEGQADTQTFCVQRGEWCQQRSCVIVLQGTQLAPGCGLRNPRHI